MIQRHIQDSIRRAMTDTSVVLLNGARQTGKTTLAQAIAGKTGAQYFTLDRFPEWRDQRPIPLNPPWP